MADMDGYGVGSDGDVSLSRLLREARVTVAQVSFAFPELEASPLMRVLDAAEKAGSSADPAAPPGAEARRLIGSAFETITDILHVTFGMSLHAAAEYMNLRREAAREIYWID